MHRSGVDPVFGITDTVQEDDSSVLYVHEPRLATSEVQFTVMQHECRFVHSECNEPDVHRIYIVVVHASV
jgi:hypothetical protein